MSQFWCRRMRRVSIVIPTFLRCKDVVELLDSILIQTVSPLEVILVDDSPTNEVELVYQQHRVMFERLNINLIYVKNPKERSAAIARNVGVERTKGNIIIFLDSDVVLYPDYIEKILAAFKQCPNALGIQGWHSTPAMIRVHVWLEAIKGFFYFEHLVRNSSRLRLREYPYALTKIIPCQSLDGCNMALKRDVMCDFKFDERLKKYSYGEDLLLTYSIFKTHGYCLYITPYAKCIHKSSEEGRMEKASQKRHIRQCNIYVNTKLFGVKGLFIHFWQTISLPFIRLIAKVAGYRRNEHHRG